MFDNPKKELERLQEQLLAAETDELQEDDVDSPYDVLSEMRSRAAGFDAEDYVMDDDRYVPAPKKKGIKGLFFLFFLVLIAAGLYIFWSMGWLV